MLRRSNGLWVPDYSKRRFCNMSGGLGSGLSELSLSSGTRGAVGSSFTPLSLSPALWIDPSDTTTMFQSNAGTTTVTDGSVCGYAGDKSGNAFNLTSAADDGTRPTWNNNGGLPYLSFDGTDDLLRRTADLGLFSAGAATVFVAVRGNPGTNKFLFNIGNSGSANTLYGALCSGGTATTGVSFFRNDTGGTNLSSLPAVPNAHDNTDNVVGITDDGSTVSGYLDNNAAVTQAYTRTGVYTLNRTSLGGALGVVASSWFAARIYGVIAVTRVVNATERQNIITYLGAKMAITL